MGLLKKCKKEGIEKFYTDTVDVYRHAEADDGYGGTVEELTLISKDNRCRLSQKTISATSGSPLLTSIQEFRLFTPLEIEIAQNDKLEVHRGLATYTFKAGQPFAYYDRSPHKEIVVQEVIENGRDAGMAEETRNTEE